MELSARLCRLLPTGRKNGLQFVTLKIPNSPVEKGFEYVETGRGDGSNELAPPVAKSCSGRGNILWRTCEYLVATAERPALLDLLLMQ